MIILADLVWPSLFLADRLFFCWWIVVSGLVIEFFFVKWLIQGTPLRASLMTVVMNATSAAVGVICIPASGIVWEFIATVTIMPIFDWGTFNPVTWLVSCILAAFLNTVIETASLRFIFKIPWTKKLFWWLLLANLITVGMALRSLTSNPPMT